jgi:SOS response regulatory protein OraA/RecX
MSLILSRFASKILSGRVARSKSKQAVMRTLQEMNIQLNAVDHIAKNVEDEFNDAKMV